MDLMQEFRGFCRPLHLTIMNQSTIYQSNLTQSFSLNLQKDGTSDCSVRGKWKTFSGPSRLPPSKSFPSQTSLGSTGLFRTFHICTCLRGLVMHDQLIVPSIPPNSHAHGVLSIVFICSFYAYHQGPKLQCKMSRKRIGQFRSSKLNGQEWWSSLESRNHWWCWNRNHQSQWNGPSIQMGGWSHLFLNPPWIYGPV